MTQNGDNLLSIKNLSTHFYTEQGLVKAVQDVSFDIPEGKTLAVVGESGCGKSVTALSVMQLIPWPPGKIVAGTIRFDGQS
ncbi:MAG: ATP-binding cassette domain-containing protein, partial [Planctomycetota bacterium]